MVNVRVILVSTFVTFIIAPGTDAPDESFTVPTIFAVGSCANDAMANNKTATANPTFENLPHFPPNILFTSRFPLSTQTNQAFVSFHQTAKSPHPRSSLEIEGIIGLTSDDLKKGRSESDCVGFS